MNRIMNSTIKTATRRVIHINEHGTADDARQANDMLRCMKTPGMPIVAMNRWSRRIADLCGTHVC